MDLHLPLKKANEPEAYSRMLENQRRLQAQLESWEKAQKNAQQRLSGILGLIPEAKSSRSDAEVPELEQELAGLVVEQKRLQSELKGRAQVSSFLVSAVRDWITICDGCRSGCGRH